MPRNKPVESDGVPFGNKRENTWEQDNAILQRILTKFRNDTEYRRQTANSRRWFMTYARKNLNKINIGKLAEGAKTVNKPVYGKLYMFRYADPKHKKTLPYYDALPLVFFFNIGKNDHGLYYGINLHYLPPKLRMVLFEQLLKIRTRGKYTDKTKIKLTWDVLRAAAEHPLFAPCVHAYYPNRVGAKFVEVDARLWEVVIPLPTEQFRKANKRTVWSNSK